MYKPTKMILTAGPSISEKEIEYVNDAIRNGWNENWNGYISKFEETFANYIGVKYALSTSSCTGALHLALLSLGIGKGDEVIVPDVTWAATASAVKYVGATPIFADINENDWCISIESIKKLYNKNTKAIIPVWCYGTSPEMDKIVKFAKDNGIKIIEDSAPAIGSEFNGQKAGSFGDFGCFSFQGAKILSTGEGGMLVTNNKELYLRAKFLGDHGRNPKGGFDILEVGYKYKMSNLQAAMGLAQIERADEIIDKKIEIFNMYKKGLSGIKGLSFNYETNNSKNNFGMSNILLDPSIIKISRDELIQKLKENLIDSRTFFPQLSELKAYKIGNTNNPIAKKISENGINLPSGHNLSNEQINYIIDNLIDLIK